VPACSARDENRAARHQVVGLAVDDCAAVPVDHDDEHVELSVACSATSCPGGHANSVALGPYSPSPTAVPCRACQQVDGAFHSERVLMGHGLPVSPPPDPREALRGCVGGRWRSSSRIAAPPGKLRARLSSHALLGSASPLSWSRRLVWLRVTRDPLGAERTCAGREIPNGCKFSPSLWCLVVASRDSRRMLRELGASVSSERCCGDSLGASWLNDLMQRAPRNRVARLLDKKGDEHAKMHGVHERTGAASLSVLVLGLSPSLAAAQSTVQLGSQAQLAARGGAIVLPITITCDPAHFKTLLTSLR
jgi:hypothetical protein